MRRYPQLALLPLLLRDPRFREHAMAGHPECPERLEAVDVALEPLAAGFREIAARPATDDEILAAHTPEHLAGLRSLEGRQARIDRDTYSAPRSLEVARLAIGGLVDAALAVARGEAPSAFAAVRPPGHHAERARPMGFCLLNNVAIAARALQRHGIERIAIVDFDVHHGNGTQHQFEAERDVLFVSTHQFPFYPGTGALGEMGHGAGEGATVNLPLPAGCGDTEYGPVFEGVVVPTLLEFDPELILVSAGFDAHALEPLASLLLTTGAFARIVAQLRAVAEQCCSGRLVLSLEGGYDLGALADSVFAVAQTLLAPELPALDFPPASPGGNAWCERFREAHGHRWASLRPRTHV